MRNNSSLHRVKFEQLKSLFLRGIVVLSLATMLAVTIEMTHGVRTVAAAGNSATTLHQDRRPDRERSVGTIRSRVRSVRR
jgi:hypothetical protein